MRTFLGDLATLVEAILVALAVPVVILAIGTPISLVVAFVLEVSRGR